MKKLISYFLLLLMLLLSCDTRYHMNNCLSINEALNQGKVKVVNTNGHEWVFKNIYAKDGIYFGLDETQEIQIDTTNISCIYLKDVKSTRKASWLIPVYIVFGLLGLYLIIAEVAQFIEDIT